MNKILELLKEIFSIFGLKLDLFPGIPIALIPLYYLINHYREDVLNLIHANQLSDLAQTSIILIIILILGVCVWKLSGDILDPIYDNFSPAKRNKNSELNVFIRQAREKWTSKNSIYADENVSIYKDTIDLMKKTDIAEFNDVQFTLAASKFFRIVIIPLLLLGIVNLIEKDYSGGIILIVVSIICLTTSFSFRAEQSRKIYKWFIIQSV